MIIDEPIQTIETVGDGVRLVSNFRITDETMSRLMVDLSDKMYNQKELAVVREISTNAADAMVKAEKPISDIQVTIPTYESLVFKVRDFGAGLSEEDIQNVYCVLGVSTKRNSNLYNGAWGYGCKAPFAHADSFTVTSWHNGVKYIYQCVKGDTTKPHAAYLLSSSPSDEPSGIEVSVPVKQSSLWTFHRVAASFYKYWPVLPTFVGFDELESMLKWRANSPTLQGEGWDIRPSNGSPSGVVYMGYVAYPINWEILYSKMALTQQTRCLFDLLKSNCVTLYCDIGDVTFVNNREGLEYTDATISTLITRINSIFEKIKDSIQSKFDNIPNIWEAKKVYNAIFGTGILDVESGESDTIERVRILDGNLYRVEETFRGMLKWNDIVLDGPSFKKINRFDNNQPDICTISDHTPDFPVMVTYRKKNKQIKVYKCKYDYHDSIVASSQVEVVINDTGGRTGLQQIAKYLIRREGSNIKVVHILRFENDALKKKFYEEYHFDTVPVKLVSELRPLAKAWIGTTSRSISSCGARVVKYINIADGTVDESDVPVREIEGGGFFIRINNRDKSELMTRRDSKDAKRVAEWISEIVDHLSLDAESAYIVNDQTYNSAWFQNAIKNGEWVSILDHINDNMNTINLEELRTFERLNNNYYFNIDSVKKVAKKVLNKDNIITKLAGKIPIATGLSLNIIYAFRGMGFLDLAECAGADEIEKDMKQIQATYPLLVDCGLKYGIHDSRLEDIANYINAMDYFNMSRENEIEAVAEQSA